MKDILCSNKDEIDKFMCLNGTLLRIELSKIGLYVGQPIILDIICKNPGLTQKMLADIGGIKPSTVNVMLSRMAKNELVEIRKDKNNSKISRVYITEKGKEICVQGLKCKEKVQEIHFNDFNEEEIKTFKTLLSKVNKNLENALDEEGKLDENN